jgi:hypothetical protein
MASSGGLTKDRCDPFWDLERGAGVGRAGFLCTGGERTGGKEKR